MARYDFRCRECGTTFEVQRPMAEASAPATCPDGHTDTTKLLSAVFVGGRSSGPARESAPVPAGPAGGGGCCGGACH